MSRCQWWIFLITLLIPLAADGCTPVLGVSIGPWPPQNCASHTALPPSATGATVRRKCSTGLTGKTLSFSRSWNKTEQLRERREAYLFPCHSNSASERRARIPSQTDHHSTWLLLSTESTMMLISHSFPVSTNLFFHSNLDHGKSSRPSLAFSSYISFTVGANRLR